MHDGADPRPVTAAATFCATLVDEWVRGGLDLAFVAPGSRSTPLALALIEHGRVGVSVHHDERSASFAALGYAKATGRATVMLCSSGTAGTHFAGAVAEADLSAIPLIVCTADRPPNLWDVGAPQVIDQTHLYGGMVRWFAEPGVPREIDKGSWRSIGSRAWLEASGGTGAGRGPVHLNLSFEDPLAGQAGELPPARRDNRPWHDSVDITPGVEPGPLLEQIIGRDGVIVAGESVSDAPALLALAARLGWPVLADHQSGCRRAGQSIAHFDSLLRLDSFGAAHRPSVVLRFGGALSSKVLSQWLAELDATVIAAMPHGRWVDAERVAATIVPEPGLAMSLLERLPVEFAASDFGARWRAADDAAAEAVGDLLASTSHTSEPQIVREALGSVPAGGALVVASSMPVRDLEWFAPGRGDVRVFANRGANGIDGTVATAIGVALTDAPTTVVLGDVAFLHDATSLSALADRTIDLTILVIDNDGGGIFGFLPQRELLEHASFEKLFGTPHNTDIEALAGAHNIRVEAWDPITPNAGGVRLCRVATDRDQNLIDHEALHAAVAAVVS